MMAAANEGAAQGKGKSIGAGLRAMEDWKRRQVELEKTGDWKMVIFIVAKNG